MDMDMDVDMDMDMAVDMDMDMDIVDDSSFLSFDFQQLLTYNPASRVSAKKALQHAYFECLKK